jgi:tRNA (pseudouridine54-N1)-methyltransferase
MRRFVVVGQRTITGDFSLNDLTGGSGRLDVLLRCINSAFFLSHGMRDDTELFLVLKGEPDPPKTIRLVGNELRGLNPDERSAAGLVKKALEMRLPKGLEKQPSDGVYISRKDLVDIIEDLGKENIYYLHEDGGDVKDLVLPTVGVFVLGDDIGLSEDDEKLLEGCKMISLGPEVLHSHHCITLLHNELDRMGI